jgi:uncharacterized membrane protein YiaA
MDKRTRLKQQKSIIQLILLIVGVLFLIIGLLFYNETNKVIVFGLGFGLLIAVIILRVFKNDFGYKPTREEIEEKIFEKK